MNSGMIAQICLDCFSRPADAVSRCAAGQGNYVYQLETGGAKYIVRCSGEAGAYDQTVRWLEKLAAVGVPVPVVLRRGVFRGYDYIVLSYLEGEDLGAVYADLSAEDKRAIAKEVVRIQEQAGTLRPEALEPDWSWRGFVDEMLGRAGERIEKNGYFDPEKADRLQEESRRLEGYFSGVRPAVYLDDISTKNLLIRHGRVSGVIDVDWIGIGDRLTYAALTNMALLNMEYETDYVQYLLEEMGISETERTAFLFYTLMYCVDFMGERGTRFMDKVVEVNPQVIARLNRIYDTLWKEWTEKTGTGDRL